MNRTMRTLIFILLMHLNLAAVLLDVETLPYHRTQQYPLKEYSHLVVFSAPRTGSSLTYNVMKFLFEDSTKLSEHHYAFDKNRLVLKTHKVDALNVLKDEKVFYLFTLRNPIDACVSDYRIKPCKPENLQTFAERLMKRQYVRLSCSETLEQQGARVERVRYEDFAENQNMDYLFTFIESRFSISIDPRDKELMRKGYSKENVHACIQNFADFTEYFPLSGFHGQHVSMQNFTPPEELLHWLNVYLEDVKPAFTKYGYQL